MTILAVHIKDFKSIVDLKLTLEKDFTILVGANEHGKSNILEAITFIDADKNFDRSSYRIDKVSGERKLPDISFELEITDIDRRLIEEMIVGEESGIDPESLSTLKEKARTLSAKIPKIFTFSNYVSLNNKDEPESFYSIDKPVEIEEEVKETIYEFLSEFANKVISFDTFDERIGSTISREAIESGLDDIVTGFLKVSDLFGVRDKLFTNEIEIRQKLDSAPKIFTENIRSSWFQGNIDNLEVKINVYGDEINIDISDGNTFIDIGSRSRGFRWFLSFFLKYRKYSEDELVESLFLIDEPGLFLHPKGQKDLLNYLKHLSKFNQVIFSTHSPFMVDRLNPKKLRVVEKKDGTGTGVNSKGYTANWRHMRTSLGITISDSFFYSDKTLLVEGIEDVLYISAYIRYLQENEPSLNIDVNLLSIISAEGADNLPAMKRIIKDEDRPMIVIMDSDKNTLFEKLKIDLGEDIFQVKDFHKDAVVIQDLLPKELYESAVKKYVEKLIQDNFLVPNSPKSIPDFSLQGPDQADKQVDQYISANFDKGSISKLGIAREFEDILFSTEYKKSTHKRMILLINKVIEKLDLNISFEQSK